ncbi:MAG: DUF881 domain-containing protein [Bacillota bacterium]
MRALWQRLKSRRFYWGFIAIGLVLGLMVATQFRVARQQAQAVPIQRFNELMTDVQRARQEQESLQARVDRLRGELNRLTESPDLAALRSELDAVRTQVGVADVAGPGIEVVLNDSSATLQPGQNPNFYVLHDEDILKVLNELRAAGAEALAINGERITAGTEIRCIGPAVLVNKTQRLTPPYVITAIGNPETMEASLKMRGGVVDTLRYWGIEVGIKRHPLVVIKAYKGATGFKYARPAPAEGGE